jgi:hypothetical protein
LPALTASTAFCALSFKLGSAEAKLLSTFDAGLPPQPIMATDATITMHNMLMYFFI